MTNTNRVKKYNRNLLKIASQDEELQELYFLVNEKRKDLYQANPYADEKQIKKQILQLLVDEYGVSDMEAMQIVRAAFQNLRLVTDTSEKFQQSDAQLEGLIKEASQFLKIVELGADGKPITTKFDTKVMDSITKAIKVRNDTFLNLHFTHEKMELTKEKMSNDKESNEQTQELIKEWMDKFESTQTTILTTEVEPNIFQARIEDADE
jgi:hypothetical protein